MTLFRSNSPVQNELQPSAPSTLQMLSEKYLNLISFSQMNLFMSPISPERFYYRCNKITVPLCRICIPFVQVPIFCQDFSVSLFRLVPEPYFATDDDVPFFCRFPSDTCYLPAGGVEARRRTGTRWYRQRQPVKKALLPSSFGRTELCAMHFRSCRLVLRPGESGTGGNPFSKPCEAAHSIKCKSYLLGFFCLSLLLIFSDLCTL